MLITERVEALWKLRSGVNNQKKFQEIFLDFLSSNGDARKRLAAIGPRAADTLNKFDRMAAELKAVEQELKAAEQEAKRVREWQNEEARRKEEEASRKKEKANRLTLAKRADYVARIAKPLFERRFLQADQAFRKRMSRSPHPTYSDTELLEEYGKQKIDFVKGWLAQNSPMNDATEQQTLDDEQADAIAATEGHIQVIARAGSGKTSTIANRALFLLRHCQIPASAVLLIAFNRKAVVEIRKRLLLALSAKANDLLRQQVGHRKTRRRGGKTDLDIESESIDASAEALDLALPHVMTFHALAYALVHPEDSLLFDGTEPAEGQALSRTVQQIIDDHLRNPTHYKLVRELMVAHFKADWQRIVSGGYDKSKASFLAYRRAIPNQALNGEYLKSYGEKVIADFLFEHDVEYKYERNHWWNGVNYRPDFTVFAQPKAGVIIEYFGLKGDLDYDKMSEKKRRYWEEKMGWDLFEVYPVDISEWNLNGLRARLGAALRRNGIQLQRLTDDEIWERIRDRAIDRFSRAMVGFIGRCRKLNLTADDLETKMHASKDASPLERQFVGLGRLIYSGYLQRLQATGEDDFDGLMQRAAAVVREGNTVFKRRNSEGDLATLQHIFIDEYQDFSRLFHDLIMVILERNLDVSLFCVGDDWQAINGFAGADLKYFRDFEEHVGSVTTKHISTNYRSAKTIVDLGNDLMSDLGRPARAHKIRSGQVALADLDDFKPTLLEQQRTPGDAITPAVTRLVAASLRYNRDVVLLARRNGIPWFVNYGAMHASRAHELEKFLIQIRSRFREDQQKLISISTTHKYKGLEKSTVIVLDAVARSYPLVHPDWIFTRLLGDNIEAIVEEERRLLYVALTRAIDTLVIVTSGRNTSSFIKDARTPSNICVLDWDVYPPPLIENRRLVVQVGNAYGGEGSFGIKDLLKAAGYRWRSTGWKSWEKVFMVAEFSVDRLKAENWAKEARGIEVRVCDESEAVVTIYRVDGVRWECIKEQ